MEIAYNSVGSVMILEATVRKYTSWL